jgi:hypothetical protein
VNAGVIVAIVLLVLIANAGAVVSLILQRSGEVRSPSGSDVRLRLTATGVKWVAWSNWDASWLLASVWWVRYLVSGPRSWMVKASEDNFRRGEPTLTGEFTTWREAQAGLTEMAQQIANGEMEAR